MQGVSPGLPANNTSRWVSLQRFLDPFIVLGTLWLLAAYFQTEMARDYLWLSTAAFLLSYPTFRASGRYRLESEQTFTWEFPRIITGWGVVVIALLCIGYLTKSSATFSRILLVSWAVSVPFVLYLFHESIQQILRSLYRARSNTRRAVVVGFGQLGRHLADQIKSTPHLGLEFCGFFDDKFPRIPEGGSLTQSLKPEFKAKVLLGRLEQIAPYVSANHIDIVLISAPITDANLHRVISDLQDTTACVYFVPNILMFNLMQARTHQINGIPLIAIWENPFYDIQSDLKRMVDIIVSVTALVLFSPLMILIAIAIRLTSPGPIIFKQRRYGLNGQEILVYKFRSMSVTENGKEVQQAKRSDPRITPVGAFLRRTSLDELPQFINVLQGRMSVVGPRPHAVAHNETYRKLIRGYMLRHKVKPGITGWAQVHGFRGETDTLDKMQKRVEYDLEYFRNWSLALDLEIIIKTALVFFNSRNAY